MTIVQTTIENIFFFFFDAIPTGELTVTENKCKQHIYLK